MGYSHSYELNEELTTEVLRDIDKVLKKYEYLSFEIEDNRSPVVTKELIRFNGYDEEDGYETFLVVPYRRDFCKTNERPYDLAVCEVLLILKAHFRENFNLSSDGFSVGEQQFKKGELDGSWDIAMDNIKRQFGYEFELKPQISYSGQYTYYSYEIE